MLLNLIEYEREHNGHEPIGNGVRDVGFSSSVVQGGEHIGSCEHVYDLDGEDQSQKFDGFQIVGKEGGHGHEEGLGQDDSCVRFEGRKSHSDCCFVLTFIYRAEGASNIFCLIHGVVQNEGGVHGPVRRNIEGLHRLSRKGSEDSCQNEGQGVVYNEKLYNGGHCAKEGNKDGVNAVEDYIVLHADHCQHCAQKNAYHNGNESHPKCIRNGNRHVGKGGWEDFKIDHDSASLFLAGCVF